MTKADKKAKEKKLQEAQQDLQEAYNKKKIIDEFIIRCDERIRMYNEELKGCEPCKRGGKKEN